MIKIYQNDNIGNLDTFTISQKGLKVNHCLYLILIFAHYQIILMTFVYYFKKIETNFDIALTESRIKKNSVSLINIALENYSIEHTPTEIAAEGALLYINKRLSYHPRNDLNIYMPGKWESKFTEIVCPKSCYIIVGCIYKHPSLQMNNFTNDIILSLLEKLNKENSKKIFLVVILKKIYYNKKHLNLSIILLTHCHPIFPPSHIAANKNLQFFFNFHRSHFL